VLASNAGKRAAPGFSRFPRLFAFVVIGLVISTFLLTACTVLVYYLMIRESDTAVGVAIQGTDHATQGGLCKTLGKARSNIFIGNAR